MGKAEAVAAAAALRHDLGLGSGYVDVFDVIRQQGIELYRRPFGPDSLEGAHMVKDGRAFIFVNTSGAITRQRMTAAHELGHHLLDADGGDSVVYESTMDPGKDPREWAVFAFARHFLMDPDGVRRLTRDIDDPEARIAAVASTFVTSIDATCIHLEDIGAITAAAKARVLDGVRAGEIRPKAFLRSFGYPFEDTPPATGPDLDPRYVRNVLDAYAREWITYPAFIDALGVDPGTAEALLGEHGLSVPFED